MNQLTIRAATEADRPALQKIWHYCFNDGETFQRWYFSKYFRAVECLVATVGDTLAASLQLIDLPTRVGDVELRAGYIVGVDCLPEYRGLGLTRRLMQAALEDYAPAHGIQLMHLMPFEADFYESYGFVFGDYHFDMDLDIDEFYRAEERDAAHCHHWQDLDMENLAPALPLLEDLYERATARYKAAVLRRGLRRWQALVDDLAMEGGYFKLLFDENEQAVGYLAYIMKEEAFFVREAVASTAAARQALYYFIASHRSQVKQVQWSAPEDEAIAFRRKKDKSGVRYQPFMMERILDPEILPLFASRLPEQDIRFSVRGCGSYLWPAGSARIEKISAEEAAPLLDLAQLTQMVFDRSRQAQDVCSESALMVALFTIKATFFNNEYF